MSIHWKFLSVFAFLVAFSAQTSARELWVDKDSRGGVCNDSRGAVQVTKATPLCSLGAAADMVVPGDLVRVRGGVYSETHQCRNCEYRAVLQLVKAGTAAQWIRWAAEPGETVILEGSGSSTVGLRIVRAGGVDPSFNEVNGFQIRRFSRDCIALQEVPDIRLIGLDVSQCTHGAVELHQAQRVTLERSRIHDNATNGWTSAVDLWQCKDGNRIAGNVIWNNSDNPTQGGDTEGHGIILDTCSNSAGSVIENNLIFNNEGYCLTIHNSNGGIIRNNVCYRNAMRQQDSGEINTRANNVSIYNNIVVPRADKYALTIQYPGSTGIDPRTISENNNLLHVSESANAVVWGDSAGTLARYRSQNGRGWGTQTIAADPRFADPAAFNFRLQAGSPAIDKGNTAQGAPKDFDGQPRPQGAATDIGAYEISSGPTLAGSFYYSTAAVNLTAVGTRDWAKWPNYIRKAGVAAQISNFTVIGTNAPRIYSTDPRVISWSDGIPTAAASDRSGVQIGGTGSGFQITAPAGIGVRTLRIYVGGWRTVGSLSAQLSDNSVPIYVQPQGSVNDPYDLVYTLTYRAKSDGQRIVVKWVQVSGTGTITLQAATLQ